MLRRGHRAAHRQGAVGIGIFQERHQTVPHPAGLRPRPPTPAAGPRAEATRRRHTIATNTLAHLRDMHRRLRLAGERARGRSPPRRRCRTPGGRPGRRRRPDQGCAARLAVQVAGGRRQTALYRSRAGSAAVTRPSSAATGWPGRRGRCARRRPATERSFPVHHLRARGPHRVLGQRTAPARRVHLVGRPTGVGDDLQCRGQHLSGQSCLLHGGALGVR